VIHRPVLTGRRDLVSRRPEGAPGPRARPGARACLAAALAAAATLAAAAAPAAHAADDEPAQWQLDARAEALTQAPAPADRPVICVVDTGVNLTPDLDVVSRVALDGGSPDDITAQPGATGHGTTVAHMAAGKVNGWGGAGAFPHARIASVRIFSEPGKGIPWQRYIRGLDECRLVTPKPVVTVLSLGGPEANAEEAAELAAKIEWTRDRHDMSVVAAAGNGGGQTDMPARLTPAVGVTGGTSAGGLCSFSARGENIDLMAPGCDLDQGAWDGRMARINGTSFAAPLVAGVLAALRAYQPELTAVQAEQLLTRTARPGRFAQIDVAAALRAAGPAAAAVADAYRPPTAPNETPTPAAGGGDETSPERPTTTSAGGTPPSSPSVVAATPIASTPTPSAPPMPAPASAAAVPDVEVTPVPNGEALAAPMPLVWQQDLASVARSRRTARPRARLQVVRGRTVLTVMNRPAGATVQIRAGGRTVSRRGARVVLTGRPSAVRVRFVHELAASGWVKVTRKRA